MLPRLLFPLTVIDRYRLACMWNVRRERTGFLPTLRNRQTFPVTQAMVGVRTRREWATPFSPLSHGRPVPPDLSQPSFLTSSSREGRSGGMAFFFTMTV